MFKLCFYVPVVDADAVKQAVFAVGAGRVGDYDCCSWECEGVGQFRPGEGSHPHIGREGRVERVAELKVEMVCASDALPSVISALLAAHPYEEPAYQYWAINPALSD